jgi:hypothetical protein
MFSPIIQIEDVRNHETKSRSLECSLVNDLCKAMELVDKAIDELNLGIAAGS